MAFIPSEKLEAMGFLSIGKNVLISEKASLYNIANISIGNNVRIDDFCILSAGIGGIEIGSYIHIAAFSSLIGNGRIRILDFSNLSSRVSIYSSNDDYTGASMTNPMIPDVYKNVKSAEVKLCKHVIVGTGSVILPGVVLGEGAAVGALSLVLEDCKEFSIYIGRPAKKLKDRKKDILKMEQELIASINFV